MKNATDDEPIDCESEVPSHNHQTILPRIPSLGTTIDEGSATEAVPMLFVCGEAACIDRLGCAAHVVHAQGLVL